MQDIKIVVKKIFWLFGIFFCCCNMQLFAQEGTYVVTDEDRRFRYSITIMK